MEEQNRRKTPQELCEEIACCENICKYFNGGLPCKNGKPHPCREIIKSQGQTYPNLFQIPEPWVGHIDKAPLLFLSSNPSIDEKDPYYPSFGSLCNNGKQGEEDNCLFKFKTPSETIETTLTDFYNNRFKYIIDEDCIRGKKEDKPENDKKNRPVPYWQATKAAALYLYNKEDNGSIECGCHYALSEVVHCKSKSETGVRKALNECSRKYLKELLRISPAKVVVVYGKARLHTLCLILCRSKDINKSYNDILKSFFDDNSTWFGSYLYDILYIKYPYKSKKQTQTVLIIKTNEKHFLRERYFIFVTHPNYHISLKKYLEKCPEESIIEEIEECPEKSIIEEIRECLKNAKKDNNEATT